jgi:hypothetical protein
LTPAPSLAGMPRATRATGRGFVIPPSIATPPARAPNLVDRSRFARCPPVARGGGLETASSSNRNLNQAGLTARGRSLRRQVKRLLAKLR